MKTSKTVGIMGGMGPAATVDLMQRIIAATPAADDDDHIRMLVDNNPKVPSRMKALIEKTGPSPLPMLRAMAGQLSEQGADLLVMPCNTAHHYYAELSASVDIPFLNIMALVSAHIADRQPGFARVGLLASSALSQIRLYEPWFESQGAEIVYPTSEKQNALMELIIAVKANAGEQLGYAALQECADALKAQNVDCLVIACTELSVVATKFQTDLPCYDAADILAHEVVKQAMDCTTIEPKEPTAS
ncbi:amino acid racemase [Congregibacter variabilis]|uniref:Amino acid racemase n=1 Tax=Congregibacter variabilis TaxID=3081200 RepID=A0ABZ0I5B4_9GAMM|nr:amino acid racemase [Congregibacter sp. IMCC43200]